MDRKESGRLGGYATWKKHGKKHYSSIGKKGFMVLVSRHFAGSKEEAIKFLLDRAHKKMVSALADIELAKQIKQGKETACVEIPVTQYELDEFDSLSF